MVHNETTTQGVIMLKFVGNLTMWVLFGPFKPVAWMLVKSSKQVIPTRT